MMNTPLNRRYKTEGILFLVISVIANPLTIKFLGSTGIGDSITKLSWVVLMGGFATGVWILSSKKKFSELFKTNGAFIFWIWIVAVGILFTTNRLYVGKIQWVRLIYVIILQLILLRFLVYGVIRNQKIKSFARNILLSLVTILFLFFVGEGICLFLARSVGSGHSLSARIWYERYWTPVNSLGYRDIEPDTNDKRKHILVLGDSYPAGHGIDHVEDRFPDLIRKKLPATWQLYNLGRPGNNTKTELEDLETFPVKPDMIILSWLINDLEAAALSKGIKFDGRDLDDMNAVPRFFILHSYFLNFIYSVRPFGHDFGYGDFLKKISSEPEIIRAHEGEFYRFIFYALSNRIPLVVVMFPMTRAPGLGKELTAELKGHIYGEERFLRGHFSTAERPSIKRTSIIDLNSVAETHPWQELTVNVNDDHPSILFHKIVADSIFNRISPLLGP